MRSTTRRLIAPTAVAVMVLSAAPGSAQPTEPPERLDLTRPVPEAIADARLDAPVTTTAASLDLDPADSPEDPIEQSLQQAEGEVTVSIRLDEPAVAEVTAEGANESQQRSQVREVEAQQAQFVDRLDRLAGGAEVETTVQRAVNSVVATVDAEDLEAIAADGEVVSIRPVRNYRLDLPEVVPSVGGTAVQDSGFDGSGITVAVFDSGIDYTHASLGGPGTLAAYEAAYGTAPGQRAQTTRDGLFPTAKVVEGYDFVGELWDASASTPPLIPDDDPIDFEGHGTHVADIVAGAGGMAPGASLLAVKVCAAVSSACSGVALLQGMDYALDPDRDGDTSDAVDLINMSLGAPYGQAFDDDLSTAVDNATAMGVLTVASAGNSSDKPFVTGSPAAAPTALSVAQTAVPSATVQAIQVTAPEEASFPAVPQSWSAELAATSSGAVTYPTGGNANGCAPFAPGSLEGQIVLVDRGACNFTLKAANVENAGGAVTIIGLVAPGEPFDGGDGGDRPEDGTFDTPAFMIGQAEANVLRAGAEVVIAPDGAISVDQTVVGSSSRGPTMNGQVVKPEIGAPGASVSAIAGTGDGTGAFGGTSGAAPVVTGAAAQLLQAYPDRSPAELRALLVNTAERDVQNSGFTPGLAPVSRIGGGEVRVDRALASTIAAWEADSLDATVSWGQVDVRRGFVRIFSALTVANYGQERASVEIEPVFRFDDDRDSGAVRVVAKRRVNLRPGEVAQVPVFVRIRGNQLPDWALDSGASGADGDALTAMEFDGYFELTDTLGGSEVHVPWHVLPRKSSSILLRERGDGAVVRNFGRGTATVETYSLLATSADLPEGGRGQQAPTPDLRYLGYATFPVPAGFCSADESFLLSFAVNTWERQTHAVAPQSLRIELDVDDDGSVDYTVLNRDLSGPTTLSDGRNLAWVLDNSTGNLSAFFFTDHITNSGNTVLTICGEQIGMNAADYFRPIRVGAFADDYYFGGPGDAIFPFTISPLGERYLGVFEAGGVGATTLAHRDRDRLEILDFGPSPTGTNETESGLLLLYRGGAPADNEAGIIELDD